jgi:predicted  nucleic acid-binding Zn-ribbon protein
MRELLNHLRLEPHGRRLLTSSASFWLFSARVMVFTMAACECASWSYLGFLFGQGAVRWVTAFFVGTVIFLVVYIIDVSLLTLDRAWREHAREILGQAPPRLKFMDVVTFGLRILLLVGSLTITAPYLAQLVFHNDIVKFVDAEAAGNIDRGRQQLVARFDAEMAAQNGAIEKQRLRYEQEVAGKGPSGRYGAGPAAQAMLADVKKLEDERALLAQQKEQALKDFDTLALDWRANRDKLAATYNVTIPQVSILENRKAMEVLEQKPEFRSTQLAIKGFLIFIFAGLLLLKLFEPSSVRLYMSDVLQQEYGRYLAGTFDAMLPVTERSTNTRFVMSPQRLYDFLVRVWVPARRLEAELANSQARSAAATQQLDVLEQMKIRINNELAQSANELKVVCNSADEAKRSLTELHSAIKTVEADLSYFHGELAALEEPGPVLDDKSRLEYAMKRLEYRSSLQRKIADADRALHELNEELPTETEKFKRASASLQRLEVKLQEKEVELSDAEKRIRTLRDQLLTSARVKAESFLRGTGERGTAQSHG